jgi:hypothetical protein
MLAATLLAASGARAEAPHVSADAKRAAQEHLDRGNELFTHDRFQPALDEFQAAFALFPSPKLRFNLGQCERALGHGPAAAEQFKRFLDEAADVSPALRAEAERYLAETPAAPETPPPAPLATAPPAPLATAPVTPSLAVVPPPPVTPTLTSPPPTPAPRPLLRRWWFWSAVGVVVAGAAVATYVLTRPRDPCDGMFCATATK